MIFASPESRRKKLEKRGFNKEVCDMIDAHEPASGDYLAGQFLALLPEERDFINANYEKLRLYLKNTLDPQPKHYHYVDAPSTCTELCE